MSDPTNNDDIIDSRAVIERIAELESELEDATETDHGWVIPESEDNGVETDVAEEAEELNALKELADEAEGYGDWAHGETLIRESYFEEYAQQLAEDIGAVSGSETWPLTCIDWEKAADELKADYMTVDFDGVDYLMRA